MNNTKQKLERALLNIIIDTETILILYILV